MDKSLSVEKNNLEFLHFLNQWQQSLPSLDLKAAIPQPAHAAILSEDVINGFCSSGSLASPRVAKIIQPIEHLFRAAWAYGLRNILLSQDSHEPDAIEFNAWPPHCIRGSKEAEAVNEFQELPFYNQMVILPKNSISAGLHTRLNEWLNQHSEVDTFIVVGDCTDLCVYQAAMYLQMDANARQISRRIIVPIDCVETYDRDLETAQAEGGLPHPADLIHNFFLYHMALNGIEIVQSIQ